MKSGDRPALIGHAESVDYFIRSRRARRRRQRKTAAGLRQPPGGVGFAGERLYIGSWQLSRALCRSIQNESNLS